MFTQKMFTLKAYTKINSTLTSFNLYKIFYTDHANIQLVTFVK